VPGGLADQLPESGLITRAWASTCPQRNVPELLLT